MCNLQFWKHYINKHTVLVKILLSYLVISVLFITTFSFIALETFSSSSKEKVDKTSINLINQSYNTVNLLFSSLYQNFHQIYNNEPVVLRFVNNSSINSETLLEMHNLLQREVVLNPIIDSIYLYNLDRNKVYSTESGISTINEFSDREITEIVNKPLKYDGQLFIPIETSYMYLDRSQQKDVISVPFYTKYSNQKVKSAMIVNIDQKQLKKLIPSNLTESLSYLFIVNSNGDIVSNLGSEKNDPNLSKEVIHSIFTSKDEKGTFVADHNGNDYFVSYIKANGLGWTFIGIGDYESLLGDFYSVQKIIIAITALFILLGIILAIVASRKIYSPLYELLDEIEYNQDTDQTVNEYDYLRGTFKSLRSSVTDLKADNTRLTQVEKTQAIVKVLNGDFTSNDLKTIEAIDESPFYGVIVGQIPSGIKPAMIEVINETLKGKFLCKSVPIEQSVFATIIFLPDHSQIMKEEVCTKTEKLHLTLKSLFNENIVLGIGDIVDDIDSIHNSYLNAKDTLKYKLVLNNNAFLLYEDIKRRHHERKEYPYKMEKQILIALKQRQENKIESYTIKFFNHIRELSIADIELFIAQLFMTIVKELQEIETGDDVYEFQGIYQQAMKFESIDEIEQYVNSLLLQAIHTVKSSSLEKKKEIVNKLIQLLNQNYQNPNLSIGDLASNVNLSESYIRTQFKEIKGKTINEYLMDLRITMAKELLMNSNHTAKDISEKVGFADNRYFYVVFKKFTGLTTEQFRKEKQWGVS